MVTVPSPVPDLVCWMALVTISDVSKVAASVSVLTFCELSVRETKARAAALKTWQKPLVVGPIRKLDHNRRPYDLTVAMIDELLYFPFGRYKDLVDAGSRLYDIEPTGPMMIRTEDIEPRLHVDGV